MLRRFWRALTVAAMGIAAAGASHTTGLTAIGTGWLVDEPARETALQLPGVEPGTKVVAAALADIDADGDLDLVASDGTLDLLVWSNDGSGHFTRKYPTHVPGGGQVSRDGTLDPASGTLPASIAPSGSASLVAADRLIRALDTREWRIAAVTSPVRLRARLARASRAPPVPAV